MNYTKDQQHIVIGMYRLSARMDRLTQQICTTYGITLGQFAVLEVLYHKGILCIGEVKSRILSSDGTIPVIIRNLEKQGYIRRFQDMQDRRKWLLELTDTGRELISRICPENEIALQQLLSQWSPEEQATISRLLMVFKEN